MKHLSTMVVVVYGYIRSSVPKETMTAEKLVSTYKSLAQVERAFRRLKSIDLYVRPIYHFNDDRIRAHVFLASLRSQPAVLF